MKYEIWFSPTSRAEIIAAFEYISSDQHAPLNAARWLDGIIEAIESLFELPGRCSYARENDDFKEELRQLNFKSHRIIFDVYESQVRVHRVVHSARESLSLDEIANLTSRK